LNANGNIGKFKWNYSLQYAYTSAENTEKTSAYDLSAGKQLVYVPKNSLNQILGIAAMGFDLNYTLNFTGERYTTSDNSGYLPAFTLHDLSLGKNLLVKRSAFYFQFTIVNLADKQYHVIAWQPMPGRNFSFSVKYVFKK
jgi:outer membrane cobalamin receptor